LLSLILGIKQLGYIPFSRLPDTLIDSSRSCTRRESKSVRQQWVRQLLGEFPCRAIRRLPAQLVRRRRRRLSPQSSRCRLISDTARPARRYKWPCRLAPTRSRLLMLMPPCKVTFRG